MLFPNQVEGIDSARTDELVFTVMHALNEPEKGMYSTWYSYPWHQIILLTELGINWSQQDTIIGSDLHSCEAT